MDQRSRTKSDNTSHMCQRLRTYFNKHYTTKTSWNYNNTIIKKLKIPERKFTNNELFIIIAIIVLHEYKEPERIKDGGCYKTTYDIEYKSECIVERNYEFDFYSISFILDEDDFKNEKLIEIANELYNCFRNWRIGENYHSDYRITEIKYRKGDEGFDEENDKDSLLFDIVSIKDTCEILIYLIDI